MPSTLPSTAAPPPATGPGAWSDWSTIGEVSAAYGVTLRALRFYEARGLLRPRREGSARYYGPRDRVRLELVLKGKRLGFSLAAITGVIGREDAAQGAGPDEFDLTPEAVARQIEALEAQGRGVAAALAELRARYGGPAGAAGAPSAAAILPAMGAAKP